jgi:hypothetical protein
MVPDLFSSAKDLMVMAGMRNMKTHGEIKNKGSMLENPESSMLNSP